MAAKFDLQQQSFDASPSRELESPVNPTDVSAGTIPAELCQFEEDCHEAGASRAVVGSERLQGLIKSCGVQDLVYRAPSLSDLETLGL